LSLGDLPAPPCDEEEFCDHDSLTTMPQLESKNSFVALSVPNSLQEDWKNSVESIELYVQLCPLTVFGENDCSTSTTSDEHDARETRGAAITTGTKNLGDNASYISEIQHKYIGNIVHSVSEESQDEIQFVCCISTEHEQLKLIPSFNILGCIEFDVLYDLSCLDQLFQISRLPCFDHCSFYAIDNFDSKGDYLVHHVYISSNFKSPFVLDHDGHLEGCTNINHAAPSFPCCVFMKQYQSQEGELCWLQPCSTVGNRHQLPSV